MVQGNSDQLFVMHIGSKRIARESFTTSRDTRSQLGQYDWHSTQAAKFNAGRHKITLHNLLFWSAGILYQGHF